MSLCNWTATVNLTTTERLEICFDDIISNEIQHINANTGFQEMKWGPGNEMWAWGRSYVSIYLH